MKDIAIETKKLVERNFDTQGSRTGEPWKDLSEETKKQRAKKGKWPGKILQVRGDLVRSFTTESGNGIATVGTNLKYARIHQLGGTIQIRKTLITRLRTAGNGSLIRQAGYPNLSVFAKRKHKRFKEYSSEVDYTINIPARPFMELAPGDDVVLRNKLIDYLLGK